MSNAYEKRCNEEWLEMVLKLGGKQGQWLWPDAGEYFQIRGDRFEAKKQNGYDQLKEIVSSHWFQDHVIQRTYGS